jgi:hypothetical protein
MTGLLLTALVLSDPAAYQSRAELLKCVAEVRRMAEPYLRVQPTDTPQILAQRHRLARMIDYVDLCAVVFQRQILGTQDLFNLCQVGRDVADAVCQLSNTPAEQLAWHAWTLTLAEKSMAYDTYLGRWVPDHSPPASRNQLRPHVELFRQNVRGVTGRYVCLAFLRL